MKNSFSYAASDLFLLSTYLLGRVRRLLKNGASFEMGNEIGCHSFAQEWLGTRPPRPQVTRWGGLRLPSFEEKNRVLRRAVASIQNIIGKKPKSFKGGNSAGQRHRGPMELRISMGRRILDELSGLCDLEFVTITDLVRRWDSEGCRLHSGQRDNHLV